MSNQHRRLLVFWTVAVALGPCVGELESVAAGSRASRGTGWPADHPRVELEGIVELEQLKRGGAGRLLDLLVGRRARAQRSRRPFGAAWDGEALLITDPDGGRVVRITPGGRQTAFIETPFEAPIGVAACDAGIVVSDSERGSVGLLDRDLRFIRWLAEGLVRPTGAACLGETIVVAETGKHRLLMLGAGSDGKGPVHRESAVRALGRRGDGDGEFNFPTSVSFGGGFLWVGDTLNFRLQRFEPPGWSFSGTFGRLGDAAGELPRLKGVAVDAAGRIWVSDAHLDQVALYRPDGTFLLALGGRGDLAGEFSFPAGIAAHPDGRVAVVDSLNLRVQIFRGLDGG